MPKLIRNLEDAFKAKLKIEYILKHYSGENDILFGVLPDTEEGRNEAHSTINNFLHHQKNKGWSKGEILKGREIEFISTRIDQIQDWYMPDNLRQIKAPDVWETIEQMEERMGEKCSGSKKYYITVCVCRRFKNRLNDLPPMIDDEVQGLVPTNSVRLIDDIRDQV